MRAKRLKDGREKAQKIEGESRGRSVESMVVPVDRGAKFLRPIVGICVAFLAWSFLVSTTSLSAIGAELGQSRFAWLGAGVGLSMLALVASGMRLQVALGAVGESQPLRRAIQLVLWNQAAGGLFGGPLAGDLAGASIGSRLWRRQNAAYLAAAPLSRGIGMIGIVITGAVLTGVAIGFSDFRLGNVGGEESGAFPWAKSIVVIAAVLAVLSRRSWRDFLLGVVNRLLFGVLKVLRNAGLRAKAIGLGIAVQVLQGGVTMVFLGAVHGNDFAWLTGAWVFVAIGASSMIPSLLGIGPRESAAVVLLAPYGVSEPEAVAAGLLCGLLGLLWALVGGISLLRIKGTNVLRE